MAVALTVQLTDEQQALMIQIARSVLGADATPAEVLAWATQVATDGLGAEVGRLGIAEIDDDAREAQNAARRSFLATHRQAWPEPEPDVPPAA